MIKACLLILLSLPLYSCASNNEKDYAILISDKSKEKINNIIKNTVIPNQNLSHGELIKSISSAFLGTPYVANTLIGGSEQNEVLVANLNEVDCFTFIDYVEALSQSIDEDTFITNLINTRYKDSSVTYYARKHFFTDWYSVAPKNTYNVTTTISSNYINVNKQLNQKTDGSEYIKGLGIIPRTITYIPGDEINQAILDKLQTGDYIGVYSPLNGLDVSHTGIVIKENNQVFYRNASSLAKNRKVVDTLFADYMRNKPGFIVLRSNK